MLSAKRLIGCELTDNALIDPECMSYITILNVSRIHLFSSEFKDLFCLFGTVLFHVDHQSQVMRVNAIGVLTNILGDHYGKAVCKVFSDLYRGAEFSAWRLLHQTKTDIGR